ncbi:ATP synthase gamma chain [hydrothermal vent metagenome]|uniref:ATP synthase gamma chain n=1 Tax=hydrothermal vent metagenome TaxID=652676 RepID=A0A3B0RCA5_9ZZZZ
MATLSDIKRRIGSVKNTQQITRAMKMVSAAKLRRAQEDIVSTRPYADKIKTLVGSLSGMVSPDSNPLFQKSAKAEVATGSRKARKSKKAKKQEEAGGIVEAGEAVEGGYAPEAEGVAEKKKIELILLTSDRGLCGGFNTSLIRMAEGFLDDHPDDDVMLYLIGKRGADHFKRREGSKSREMGVARPDYAMAKAIAAEITEDYLEDRADEVCVIYSEFQSALTQEPVLQKILPATPPPVKEEAEEAEAAGGEAEAGALGEAGDTGVESDMDECILEPSAQEVLDSLLPKYIEIQIFRSLLESSASEHGARMTSMDSASRNASDMIDNLTLIYNRVRQAAITKELMEIISGAEALK